MTMGGMRSPFKNCKAVNNKNAPYNWPPSRTLRKPKSQPSHLSLIISTERIVYESAVYFIDQIAYSLNGLEMV